MAGSRPGGRTTTSSGMREVERRPGWRHELEGLGRWVENRLDRLLDDEESDWREPWQDDDRSAPQRGSGPRAAPAAPTQPSPSTARPAPARRALEAISRRGPGPLGDRSSRSLARSSSAGEAAAADPPRPGPRGSDQPNAEAWPDDALFTVTRWSRPTPGGAARSTAAGSTPGGPRLDRESQPAPAAVARPLPRSSRRRTL
ncbi:MAG: hypothetical protein ACKN89_11585 [Cyanobium sp.]|nr:hypothetical protein [Synechococcaceae cyanobacterium]